MENQEQYLTPQNWQALIHDAMITLQNKISDNYYSILPHINSFEGALAFSLQHHETLKEHKCILGNLAPISPVQFSAYCIWLLSYGLKTINDGRHATSHINDVISFHQQRTRGIEPLASSWVSGRWNLNHQYGSPTTPFWRDLDIERVAFESTLTPSFETISRLLYFIHSKVPVKMPKGCGEEYNVYIRGNEYGKVRAEKEQLQHKFLVQRLGNILYPIVPKGYKELTHLELLALSEKEIKVEYYCLDNTLILEGRMYDKLLTADKFIVSHLEQSSEQVKYAISDKMYNKHFGTEKKRLIGNWLWILLAFAALGASIYLM
jgi:hypothetical protein